MAYERTTWENREVETPRTYTLQTNADGSVTLVPKEGTIIKAGTPISAAVMNNIEEGILALEASLTEVNQNYIRQPGFGPAVGNKDYTMALSPPPTGYYEGFWVTIVPQNTNLANPTLNVNGLGTVPLKDQRGNAYAAGRLLAGKPYSFRKVGTDFLADSAGGNGSAQPAQVLAPQTFTNDNGEFTGTMPHITSSSDPALGAAQWSNGDLAVYPREGYRKGGAGAGELRVTTAQLQAADPELRSDRILENNNIFGVPGAIPNNSVRNTHMPGTAATVWSGDRFFIQPPAGYYNGSTWVTAAVPNLTPKNVRRNVQIADMVGTMDNVFTANISTNFQPGYYVEWFRFPAGVSYGVLLGDGQIVTYDGSKAYIYVKDRNGLRVQLYEVFNSPGNSNRFVGGVRLDVANRTAQISAPYGGGNTVSLGGSFDVSGPIIFEAYLLLLGSGTQAGNFIFSGTGLYI